MDNTHYKSSFLSFDGEHKITYYVLFPQSTPKGAVQISHGICDSFERYNKFAEYLAQYGYIVFGNDHVGNGESVSSPDDYGCFNDEDGWKYAVEDMFKTTMIIKKEYSDIPFFMVSHSMGSLLARAYAIKHSHILSGTVYCSTVGSMSGIPMLLSMIDGLKAVHGGKYRSRTISRTFSDKLNKHIHERITDYDWVSRDEKEVSDYVGDERYCYVPTLNGYENMAEVLWYVSSPKWYSSYPRELPTYLLAGMEDPVGDYSKGALEVFNSLNMYGCTTELKAYKDARHDLFHDSNSQEVFSDIADFLNKIANKEMEKY